MKKRDDIVQEARDRYEAAREYWGPIYSRIREDLDFSDAADPRQWPDDVRRQREGAEGGPRPCMTFDLIGQFVRQVLNTARRNKPAIRYLPVDQQSDPQTAEILQGLARQTEYDSRAEVAYIGALDNATRGGLGFFRLVLEEMRDSPIAGQQCARIVRVPDFEAVLLDPDYVQPDGSDARFGFVEEQISRKRFEKLYPKARAVDFDEHGWYSKDKVRICEYYRVIETTERVITVAGQQITDEQYAALLEIDPTVQADITERKASRVEHFKLTGEEVLSETVFPAEHVPLIPVIGNESWRGGKRMLGGCVRTARDPQIAYNLARNAEAEAINIGPKAPWIAPAEAIEGYENIWQRANAGNVAVLVYNSIDEAGNPVQKPERTPPAGMQPGWVQLREASRNDVQAALGMFESSVGNNPNSQSGRAVLALQQQSDTGTYHYVDNLALSISHAGRLLTQIWPAIYDQAQVVRILGEDDEPQWAQIDPNGPAYAEGDMPTINPSVGRYDVRVTVGPSYSTKQSELAAEFGQLINGNPQMMALLGDLWVKWRNVPDAERVAKRFRALLPPQVAAAERDDDKPALPPEVQQALQAAGQEIQQLRQALQQAQSQMQTELLKSQTQIRVAELNNDAKRDIEELKGMVQLLIQQMQPPPSLTANVMDDLAPAGQPAQPWSLG